MKKKAQSGVVLPDWYQQYTQTYGGIFPQNQNGYINNQMQPMNGSLPEVQVTAQGNPNQRYYGIQEPQPLPVNYQRPQLQPVNQPQYQPSSNNQGISQQSAMNTSNGIASVATGIGDVFDFFGDIKRGLLMGGASILNSLIPDQFNKRGQANIIAYNPDQYGRNQYNNMYENGGTINIPKENRGLFTRKADAHDMSVQQYANYVLNHKEDFPLRTERQAQFAKNFNGNKAQNGKTIYVDDVNDPRYKAYQDSLQAYRHYLDKSSFDRERGDRIMIGPKNAFLRPITIEDPESQVMINRKRKAHPNQSGWSGPNIYDPETEYKNMKPSMYWLEESAYNEDRHPRGAYYPPPVQPIQLRGNMQQRTPTDPTPQVPNISRIPALGLQEMTSRPQGRLLQWDNVVNNGVFPTYGSDNRLQGMWDTDLNGQTYFYPSAGQEQIIPRGLPSNTIIQNPYPTPTNVREMEKGGKLSASKYEVGKEYDLDEQKIQDLIKQGYKIKRL